MTDEENNDLDDFDLDDLDDFNFNDDVDKEIQDPNKSKKRQAVEDVFKGSIEGVSEYAKNKDNIRKFILKALPEEYTSIHEQVDKTTDDIRSLYDSAIKDIKPKLHNVTNKIDRLIPENQKFIKDTLKSIKKKTETISYQGSSQEDIQNKTIDSSLEDIFKTKEERDKKNKLLDEAVETKKFKITNGQLVNIDNSLAKLTSYTTNITQAFQKKSLELQYKSYFVQSELLKTTADLSKVLTKQNEAIVKNTALPEFVKIQNSEIFQKTLKEKSANALSNTLFGKDSLASTLSTNIKNSFRDLKEGILTGLDAAETLADASLMSSEMEDILGEKKSGAHKLGNTISSTASGFVADKIADKIKDKIPEDSKINKVGKDVFKYFKDPNLLKEKLANSDFVNNSDIGSLKNSLGEILVDLVTSSNKSNLTGKVNESGELTNPGIFTNRTNKSITEVIPGYLSRILRELNIIRTGDTDSPLVLYDTKTSKFITEKNIHTRLEKELKDTTNNTTTNKNIDELLTHITGDTKLTEDEIARKTILKAVMESSSSSPETLIKTLKNINSPLSEELVESIEKNIVNITNSKIAESELTNKFINTKSELVNINRIINDYIESGYSDVLEKSGIIKINDNGSYAINKDKYVELSTDGKLDKILNNGEVVNNTNLFSTRPTPNTEESEVNQESIFSNFDGKDISDSLNKLIEQDNAKKSILDKIYDKLNDVINVKVKSFNTEGDVVVTNNETSSENVDELSITSILKSIFDAGTFVVGKTFNIGKGIAGGISNVGKSILDKVISNKDFITKTINNVLSTSFDITKSASGYIFNTLKTTGKKLLGLGGKTGNLLKKGIDVLTDYRGDIYIPGLDVPVLKSTLLKAGHYIDERTGKVIESVKDITGTVIDIDGNVILSLEDFSKGLYDKFGNKIKIGYDKILDTVKNHLASNVKRAKKVYNLVKDKIIKKGLSSFKDIFNGTINISNKDEDIYKVLVEIRDILKDKLSINTSYERPTNSQFEEQDINTETNVEKPETKYTSKETLSSTINNVKDIKNKISKSSKVKDILNKGKERTNKVLGSKRTSKVKDILSKGKGIIGGLTGSMFDSETTSETNIPEDPKEIETKSVKKKPIKTKASVKSKGIIDDDADGIKDNSVLDRLKKEQEREEARKGKESKADLSLKYRESNVLDNILNKLSGFISKAGDILGGLAGLASVKGIKDTIGSIFNKGKGKLTGGKKTKTPKKLLSGIKSTASKSLNIAKTAGKFALGAGGTILRTAALAGGSLLTGLGYATTAALSIISSPVVLGAAALAATGYGLYKTYQFITENNYDDYNKIRLTQYGLTLTDLDKNHVHELLNLEKYLNEGRVGFNNGVAYLLTRKIDIKEMYSIFSIDEQDEQMTSRFLDWFENRFKPFYLTHLTALFSVNKKISLDEIDELKGDELSRYLSLISFDSGPYNYSTSPFKDLDTLPDTKNISKTFINEAITKSSTLKASGSKPSELKSVIEKSRKNIEKHKLSNTVVNRVSSLNKEIDKENIIKKNIVKDKKPTTKSFSGEEATIKQDTSAPSEIKVNIPKTAGGPLATGEEGYSFIKKGKHINIEGLNPAMKKNFLAMAEEYGKLTGKSIHVNSGYRSTKEQERLYRQNPRKAARPGRSLHEFGLAVDINTVDANELDKLGLMRKYGFTRPVGGETWHTEPAGIQGRIPEVKINKVLATDLVEASLGRGGAGYATLKTAKKNRRDNKYALSLLEAPVKTPSTTDTKPDTSIKTNSTFTGVGTKTPKEENKVVDIKTKKPLTIANAASFDKKPTIQPEVKGKPELKVVKTSAVKKDIADANENGEKKPKESLSVFKKPNKQLDSGQSLASTNIDTNVTTISETLTETLQVHKESLDVQKNMLELIKLVAENTDPDKLNEAKEVLKRPTNTSKNEQRTDLPINLKRRV